MCEVSRLVLEDCWCFGLDWGFHGVFHVPYRFLYDKVTVLESEKRAWKSSAEARAIRDALNPWRKTNYVQHEFVVTGLLTCVFLESAMIVGTGAYFHLFTDDFGSDAFQFGLG